MREEELERQAAAQKEILEVQMKIKALEIEENKRRQIQEAQDKAWLAEYDNNSLRGSVVSENVANAKTLTEQWVNDVNTYTVPENENIVTPTSSACDSAVVGPQQTQPRVTFLNQDELNQSSLEGRSQSFSRNFPGNSSEFFQIPVQDQNTTLGQVCSSKQRSTKCDANGGPVRNLSFLKSLCANVCGYYAPINPAYFYHRVPDSELCSHSFVSW